MDSAARIVACRLAGDGELFFELLLFGEGGVVAVAGDELVVGAELGDAAVDEDGDLVGVAGGGDAVGDEDGGAALHDLAQAGEDLLFGVGVDGGERVVEDEDARVADEGAGDGGALLLAAGEGDAALADHGVEAAREFEDLVGDVGGRGGFQDLLGAVASGRPKAMFCAMVSEKRKVSCGTKPMFAAQVGEGVLADGRPSIRTEPCGRVVEARDEETRVDLPEPVGPTMASEEPAGMSEVDVVQDLRAARSGRRS